MSINNNSTLINNNKSRMPEIGNASVSKS